MTEGFFPAGSRTNFMHRANTRPNLDAVPDERPERSTPKGNDGRTRSSNAAARDGRDGREAIAGMIEERILLELRGMGRQIQAACAEEIKSASMRMVQEIKREIQSAMEQSKQVSMGPFCGIDMLPCDDHERLLSGSRKSGSLKSGSGKLKPGELVQVATSLPTTGVRRSLKKTRSSGRTVVGKKVVLLPTVNAIGTRPTEAKAFMPGTQSAIVDPRCPLTAYGDMPPMLNVDSEPSPPPPIVEVDAPDKANNPPPQLPGALLDPLEAGGGVENSGAELRRVVSYADNIDTISGSSDISGFDGYSDGEWDEAEAVASKRKLSLSVDVCRRSIMMKDTRPIWKMSAKDFLNSTRFDNMVGALILLNALTIGVQTDYAAKNVTDVFPESFQIIERIFLACFTMELALRIYVQRCRFFIDTKNIVWNYFDTVVVMAQIFEESLTLVTVNSNVNADQFKLLRVLRILRIVRILRVVRVLHLISELRTIVSSICGSFKSLGWTVVLLLLVIYIVGVYFTQAITDHLVEVKKAADLLTSKDLDLKYFFGSLSRTILSLWQAMSGGADWDTMAGPLIDQVGVLQGLMFAGFIAFALLALMNVVTGVFVQTALQSAKDEEDAFLVDQVLKLFDKADNKETEDTITLSQIEERLKDPAVAQEWKSINVQPAEAQYLFSLLDIDETGEVSFQEFLSGCLRLHGPSKSMDVLTIMQEARSQSRAWSRSAKRIEEYHYNFQNALEEIATAVAASSNLLARLSMNIDTAIDVANQNQDKIGRLEKRIRSFEGSLCSVRIAASNMNKVNDLLDSVIIPNSPLNGSGNGNSNRAHADNSETETTSANRSHQLGHLCRIDEV